MLSLGGVGGHAITRGSDSGADCTIISLQPSTLQLCSGGLLQHMYGSPLILLTSQRFIGEATTEHLAGTHTPHLIEIS